ncbi:hypothetical protein ACAW74_16920 [Fibrella sp. WM1]|uniref:hypothetical protein n=1 Tax=Fibrella musci TaxID=3242485 RepID=UPI003521522A
MGLLPKGTLTYANGFGLVVTYLAIITVRYVGGPAASSPLAQMGQRADVVLVSTA